MVRFDHKKSNTVDAFCVTPEEVKLLKKMLLTPAKSEDQNTVTWMVQRVWIDEQLSDNAKAFMIFELGRAKGMVNMIFP